MPTYAPTTTRTQRELIPEGTHVARIYEYVHLGTQKGEWEGKELIQYKLRFSFEFPTEKRVFSQDKGEQPMSMSYDTALSFHEKSNLRKLIEACYGKKTDAESVNFDVDTLIGQACLVSVAHKPPKDGIVYAYISGFMPLMKGLTVDEQINPSKVLTFEHWNEELFQALPQFVKDKITASPEYKTLKNEGVLEGKGYNGEYEGGVEDIPFD